MNEVAASLIYVYTKESLYKDEIEKYDEVFIAYYIIRLQMKKKIYLCNLIHGNLQKLIYIHYLQL